MEQNCESVPVSVRPGKCLTEYRLPQPLRPLEIGFHLGLGFAGDGEQTVDFGDDACLLGPEVSGEEWTPTRPLEPKTGWLPVESRSFSGRLLPYLMGKNSPSNPCCKFTPPTPDSSPIHLVMAADVDQQDFVRCDLQGQGDAVAVGQADGLQAL